MGPILGKVLTSLGTEKLIKAVIMHLGDWLVAKSSNKLDDKLWAEVKKALDKLSTNRLTNHDIYVSIEPCPMCATAIAKTHIRRLYFGAEDEKGGGVINGPKIYNHSNLKVPEVISHCFAEETANLLKKFFKSKRNL